MCFYFNKCNPICTKIWPLHHNNLDPNYLKIYWHMYSGTQLQGTPVHGAIRRIAINFRFTISINNLVPHTLSVSESKD